jgi:hypothetical protein
MADSQRAAQPTQTGDGSTPNDTIQLTVPRPMEIVNERNGTMYLKDGTAGGGKLLKTR